ncbi:acyltransferase family protein [Actinomadura rugatobispora]|uniref:Acyltransferase family protein n=1 Tax=Actinomadura rugatobispora TaxID=1994 RepID=A0ABW0ZU15_9ACTN|nr:acyltransferase [Actinomadura rugatobispora]
MSPPLPPASAPVPSPAPTPGRRGARARAGRRAKAVGPDTGTGAPPAVRSRLRELDLLRFIAAAVVMVYHFTGVPTAAWGQDARVLFHEISDFTREGLLAVELFFLISGFVILMSVWGRQVGDFAVSRLTRLFPAYWFAVTLGLVIFLATGIHSGTTGELGVARSYLPNLTMLQDGWHVPKIEVLYWTLWTELHFYVLVAILVGVGLTYARCVIFMVTWLLAAAFAVEAGGTFVNSLLISGWAPFFIAGMAFYLIHRFGSNLILWLIVLGCYGLSTHFSVKRPDEAFRWPGVDEWLIPTILAVLFLVMALVATGKLRWMSWRGFTVMGGLTYPLYLMHETVSRPLIKTLFPYYSKWNVLALAILTSLAAAYLVQKVVEEPLQRMLRPRLKRALAQIRAGGEGTDASAAPARPARPGGDGGETGRVPRGRHVLADPDPAAGWPDPAVAVHGPPPSAPPSPYGPPPSDGPPRGA